MKINFKYIFIFLFLLIIEIIIALFVNDSIVRPYIGDVLVIILLYALIRGIVQKTIRYLPVYLFIFASIVEVAQYYHFVNMLNLQNNKAISIIVGSSFDTKDILCYLTGTVILILWAKFEK